MSPTGDAAEKVPDAPVAAPAGEPLLRPAAARQRRPLVAVAAQRPRHLPVAVTDSPHTRQQAKESLEKEDAKPEEEEDGVVTPRYRHGRRHSHNPCSFLCHSLKETRLWGALATATLSVLKDWTLYDYGVAAWLRRYEFSDLPLVARFYSVWIWSLVMRSAVSCLVIVIPSGWNPDSGQLAYPFCFHSSLR